MKKGIILGRIPKSIYRRRVLEKEAFGSVTHPKINKAWRKHHELLPSEACSFGDTCVLLVDATNITNESTGE